ncbi:unnamed protein product [Phytophthora lilii]|uniref:Unnamed protein product n=1 Tax=Phytophthora lilii TaxID=2077276 RepID=A0A9W6TNW9_9STRA|nr:unnamed protein product [Phytophthora lilii]
MASTCSSLAAAPASYAQKGAEMLIVARGLENLEKLVAEIEAMRKNTSAGVFIQPSGVADFGSAQKAVDVTNKFHDRVTDNMMGLTGLTTSCSNT